MAFQEDYTFTFTWKILNYCLCNQEIGKAVRSPEVIAEPLWGTKWNLVIYPRGMESYEKYVSCFLERKDGQKKNVYVTINIKMMTKENKVLKYQQYENVEFEKCDDIGWPKFIEIKDVIYGLKNSNLDALFICCIIKRTAPKIPTAVECVALTTIDVERANFVHSVSSLEYFTFEKLNLFISHLLPLDILFSTNGDNLDIDIRSLEKSRSLVVHMRITLLDVRGNSYCTKFCTHFFKDINNWRFPTLISKQLLDTNIINFYQNNKFNLKFEILLSRGVKSEEIECYTHQTEAPLHNSTLLLSLKDDMKHIFESKKHCDVEFRLGEKLLPAHKSILAARSPVFSAMFDQNMVESQNNVVDISDIDEDILLVFLKFIYTSVVENIKYKDIQQLLIVADKYQVQSLIEECSSLLISALSKENVCEVFTLADMISHQSLKYKSLNFMVDNAADILRLSSWNQWTERNIKLVTEFFSRLTSQYKSVTNSSSTTDPNTFH